MKAVTNMLQHLQHIASTWSRVLPTNAYYKSLGQIGSLSLSLCRLITYATRWHTLRNVSRSNLV